MLMIGFLKGIFPQTFPQNENCIHFLNCKPFMTYFLLCNPDRNTVSPDLAHNWYTWAQFFKSNPILDNGLDQILKMGFSKKKKGITLSD